MGENEDGENGRDEGRCEEQGWTPGYWLEAGPASQVHEGGSLH